MDLNLNEAQVVLHHWRDHLRALHNRATGLNQAAVKAICEGLLVVDSNSADERFSHTLRSYIQHHCPSFELFQASPRLGEQLQSFTPGASLSIVHEHPQPTQQRGVRPDTASFTTALADGNPRQVTFEPQQDPCQDPGTQRSNLLPQDTLRQQNLSRTPTVSNESSATANAVSGFNTTLNGYGEDDSRSSTVPSSSHRMYSRACEAQMSQSLPSTLREVIPNVATNGTTSRSNSTPTQSTEIRDLAQISVNTHPSLSMHGLKQSCTEGLAPHAQSTGVVQQSRLLQHGEVSSGVPAMGHLSSDGITDSGVGLETRTQGSSREGLASGAIVPQSSNLHFLYDPPHTPFAMRSVAQGQPSFVANFSTTSHPLHTNFPVHSPGESSLFTNFGCSTYAPFAMQSLVQGQSSLIGNFSTTGHPLHTNFPVHSPDQDEPPLFSGMQPS